MDQTGVPRVNITASCPRRWRQLGPVPEGNWEVKDNVSWTQGSHFFKAGYHFRLQYFAFGLETVAFNFTNDRYTGNAFANLLLGYVTQATEGSENS